jgi:hypothetical protein
MRKPLVITLAAALAVLTLVAARPTPPSDDSPWLQARFTAFDTTFLLDARAEVVDGCVYHLTTKDGRHFFVPVTSTVLVPPGTWKPKPAPAKDAAQPTVAPSP